MVVFSRLFSDDRSTGSQLQPAVAKREHRPVCRVSTVERAPLGRVQVAACARLSWQCTRLEAVEPRLQMPRQSAEPDRRSVGGLRLDRLRAAGRAAVRGQEAKRQQSPFGFVAKAVHTAPHDATLR